MPGIDLEDRLEVRHFFLAHGLEEVLHLDGRVFFVHHDAGGRIGKAGARLHLLDLVLEDLAHALDDRIDLLLGLLVLVGLQVLGRVAPVDRLELDVLVLVDRRHDDLVDLVVHDEHLDVLRPVHFQERRAAQGLLVFAGDVVDGLLVGLHALLVLGQAHQPLLPAGLPAHELEERVAVGEVLVEPLLDGLAELPVELGVLFLVHGQRRELGEDFLDRGGLDVHHHPVLLEDLAAHVQGQVVGIDDALDEAQVGGEQVLLVVGDEDALDVELHPRLVVHVEEVEGRLFGNEEKRRVLERALGVSVHVVKRVLRIVGDRLVELVVVLLLELVLGPLPERRGRVDLLGLFGLLLVLLLRVVEENGERNVVRIFFDDGLDLPALGVLDPLVVQAEDDVGAGLVPFGRLEVEAALAVARPAEGRLAARLARDDLGLLRHHEDRVEPHAELADEARVDRRAGLDLGQEFAGARIGDGAEVVHQVLLAHADAGVGHGEGLGLLVEADIDARVEGDRLERLVGEGQVLELVERVRGIGDELAQEDLLVRVEGVDDELQELAHLGLEFVL